MSLYKGGDVWWYKFRFAGQVVRESSKSESKTVAKDAERARHRELEGSFNRISRPRTAQLFSAAAETWPRTKTAHLSPRSVIIERANLKHLNPYFGKCFSATWQPTISRAIRQNASKKAQLRRQSISKWERCARSSERIAFGINPARHADAPSARGRRAGYQSGRRRCAIGGVSGKSFPFTLSSRLGCSQNLYALLRATPAPVGAS